MADITELAVRYRAEGQETVRQANRDIATTGRDAEASTKALEDALRRMGTSSKEAETGAKAVSTATKEASRSIVDQINAVTGVTRVQENDTRKKMEAATTAQALISANSGVTRSVTEQINALTGVTRAQSTASQSTAEWAQELRQQSSSFDSLRSSVDPAFAATMRYERAVEQANAAVRAGIVSQKEANQVLSLARARYTAVAQGAGTMAVSTAQATRAFGGFDLRGPMLQMSQIVQQTAATGNAMQAVAIQAADIGMYFGVVGTAVGMASTVLIPYVANLWDTEAATKAAEKAQEEWQESLASAEDHIAQAESALRMLGENGLDSLIERYGEATDAVKELVREFASLEEEAAAKEIASLIGDNLVGQIAADMEASAGAVAGVMLQPMEELAAQAELMRRQIADERATLQAMQSGTLPFDQQSRLISEMEQELAALEGRYQDMGTLTEQLGPDASQVERIRDMMEALDAAAARQNFEAVAHLISEIRSTADRAGIELDTDMRRTLAEIEDIARKFVNRLEDAKDEADGIVRSGLPGVIGDAADYALNFANDLVRAFGAAKGISDLNFGNLDRSWVNKNLPGIGVAWDRASRVAGAVDGGILDLIAAAEGTDFRPGTDSYNETLDYGRWTGGDVNLVNMTLREVLELQSQMRTPENRALYGDGAGSSAVGRYQIVGDTLEMLIQRLGLTGSEMFDPQMQDRLAYELIRVQGADSGTWSGLSDVPQNLITTAMGQQSIPAVDPELTRAQAKATREAEQAERKRNRELERTETGYDRVRASIDPLIALQQGYEAALEAVSDAEKAGLTSAEEAAEVRAGLAAKYAEDLVEAQKELDEAGKVDLEPVRQGWESLTQALRGAAQAGESVGEALKSWILDATLNAMLRDLVGMLTGMSGGGGVMGAIGGAFSWLFGGANAKGNAFAGGQVVPFANGGAFTNSIVGSPTMFPMAGGKAGLMGEAGPEAIMPLTRVNGKLGVAAQSGGSSFQFSQRIINQAGVKIETRERETPAGRVQDMIISDAVSRGMTAPGGKAKRLLDARAPQGITRR